MKISQDDRAEKYKHLLSLRRIVDGCWEWKGPIQNNKVPMTSWKKKSITVRRCMYFISFSLKDDFPTVYSKCQNYKCFNPEHLTLERPKNRRIY